MARIPLIDELDRNTDPGIRAALQDSGTSRGWVSTCSEHWPIARRR